MVAFNSESYSPRGQRMAFGQPRNRVQRENCPMCGNDTVLRVEQHSAPDGWYRRQDRVSLAVIVLLVIAVIELGVDIYIHLTAHGGP